MKELTATAAALRYPMPNGISALEAMIDELDPSPTKRELAAFVRRAGELTLGQWEELHTRTLDLSPMFVPYVGHVAWGENYRRGDFMAGLKRAQDQVAVDRFGELPDHLEPVLRYLAATQDPAEDLVEVLPSTIDAMRKDLKKAEKDNPYRHVLAAAAAAVRQRLAEGAAV